MTILGIGNRILIEYIKRLIIRKPSCLLSLSECNIRDSESKKRSFTLLELIVTVVILSSGILFIYKGFLSSLDVSYYVKHYLYAQLWTEEKLYDIDEEFRTYKAAFLPQASGSFNEGNKNFSWQAAYSLIGSTEKMSLYDVTLVVSWKEGRRNINLARSKYIYYTRD